MSQFKPLKNVKKGLCFICGVINERDNRKIGIFNIPKNKLNLWQEIIPNLKENSKLCDSHFDPEDIVKGVKVGENFHPSQRWRLTSSALPKHLLCSSRSMCTWKPLKFKYGCNKQTGKGSSNATTTMKSSLSTNITGLVSQANSNELARLHDTLYSSGMKVNCKASKRLLTKTQTCSNQLIEKNKSNIVTEPTDESSVNSNQVCGLLERTTEEIITGQSVNDVALTVNQSWNSDHNYVSVSLPNEITGTTYSNASSGNEATVQISDMNIKGLKVEKITSPNDCLKCKKEIKRKCATCQIREMKSALKKKDKQLKCIRYQNVKLEKILSITKRKHQDKVKIYRKQINTWQKRYERLHRYSMEVATNIDYLKNEVLKLTANQLEEKLKQLSHRAIR